MAKRKAVTIDGYTATQMQNLTINLIYEIGGRAWRNNTGAAYRNQRLIKYGEVGSGDVIGFLPDGLFISVEIKTLNDSTSAEQIEFIEQVRAVGGVAFIAAQIKDVDDALALYRSRADWIVKWTKSKPNWTNSH